MRNRSSDDIIADTNRALITVAETWPDVPVAFSSILPRKGTNPLVKSMNSAAKQINTNILRLCQSKKNFHYLDNDALVYHENKFNKSFYDPRDPTGVHVSDEGAEELYANFLAFVFDGESDELVEVPSTPGTGRKRGRGSKSSTPPSANRLQKQGRLEICKYFHKLFNWIKDNDYDFALLQETHCSTDFEAKIWSSQWNGNAFWNNGDSNSKGVAILVNKKVSYVCVENISHMIKGRFQTININVDADKTFTISNVYAPNNTVDKKIFFTEINRALKAIQNEKHIIGVISIVPKMKTVSIDIKEDESLPSMNQIIFNNELDIWRRRHPKTKMYTFKRNKSYSRIDYILTSKFIGNEVDSCTIEHFPLLDHDAISIKLVMETETRGPGLWKMNTSILENPEFVKRFELFWKEWTKQKCKFSTLTSWWEIAKIRIKEISIDFCKELNKSKTGIKQLEKTMEQLKQEQLTDDICSEIQLLSEKKSKIIIKIRQRLPK
ncbi:YTX2-like protein [Mya arenaria]|uniref:YTX2-like protein n=1 Tax=Mya arenaria TaxID=6604 RepID=A0ABY7FRJ9_MYAAR|nr:YTX2-like protein [Mya arenaria]